MIFLRLLIVSWTCSKFKKIDFSSDWKLVRSWIPQRSGNIFHPCKEPEKDTELHEGKRMDDHEVTVREGGKTVKENIQHLRKIFQLVDDLSYNLRWHNTTAWWNAFAKRHFYLPTINFQELCEFSRGYYLGTPRHHLFLATPCSKNFMSTLVSISTYIYIYICKDLHMHISTDALLNATCAVYIAWGLMTLCSVFLPWWINGAWFPAWKLP